MPRKPFDLMPGNGAAPNHLLIKGAETPKFPVKAFVVPAEAILQVLKMLDGETCIRQSGLPSDAKVCGLALANGLQNTMVIFVTSNTWPLVSLDVNPEPAELKITVEKVSEYVPE